MILRKDNGCNDIFSVENLLIVYKLLWQIFRMSDIIEVTFKKAFNKNKSEIVGPVFKQSLFVFT